MASFHILVVGWDRSVVEKIGRPIADRSELRFSFVMHPREVLEDASADEAARPDTYFFSKTADSVMPEADMALLESLERPGVPTIHNMIMGDRVVSKLEYREALRFATFLAKRLRDLMQSLKPSVVIGAFDALHSGIGLAVARQLSIPWFALNFSVIPSGLACFCDRMSPAARVQMSDAACGESRALAATTHDQFVRKAVQAPAYVTPPGLSLMQAVMKIPTRLVAVARTVGRARRRRFRKFTELPPDYNLSAAIGHLGRTRAARRALRRVGTVRTPPATPYVLFGLHMQPESSIDVLAPFFSNQLWVIELIARSIPPTHGLLVKIHKSDAAHYSRKELDRMLGFPGVRLVEPYVSAREFIEAADLVIGIQGTMGLEAALLGKPVIMLGESPVSLFPNVSRIGEIWNLPELIRRKLSEKAPDRDQIIAAYATYLGPFINASHNDWTVPLSSVQIDAYVRLFDELRAHLKDVTGKEELRPISAT